MAPGPPDRPSLCAVVGARRTIALDAGSSAAHTREFLHALARHGVPRPTAVVFTHFHWDHVLGGAELCALVIAHALTAEGLRELASRDWSDEGLDRRVADGLAAPEHAAHLKAELPSPRVVEVAQADVVFEDRLELELGDVRVRVRHVGGDHSPDSTVMLVEPDRVLFIGDAIYASPRGVLTPDSAWRLRDTILGLGAERYVEGHHESVSTHAEMVELYEKMAVAEESARAGSELTGADEDTEYFRAAFAAGLG
jgi:glyoxylase-like metal-dependent hydrolase (beta-lactamase superfamily II)